MDELKKMAKAIFSKAVSAVDPAQRQKEMIHIEKDHLLIKTETDASGAVADHTTVSRARSMGLDPKAHLENNDAYPFFQRLGDLLITGPTHTNVMDIRILLVD